MNFNNLPTIESNPFDSANSTISTNDNNETSFTSVSNQGSVDTDNNILPNNVDFNTQNFNQVNQIPSPQQLPSQELEHLSVSVNQSNENRLEDTITNEDQSLQRQRINALSISSIRMRRELEQSLEKNIVNPEDLPKDSFTYDSLMSEWQKYGDKLARTGLMLMYSLMGMCVPRLNNCMITIELPNQGSKLSFDENKYDLVNYLRKRLNNYDIEIIIEVNEEIKIAKKVMDNKDKYEHFVNLNADVEVLKEIFDLEIR